MASARWKKLLDVNALKEQMETYCENGLQPWSPNKQPYASGNYTLFLMLISSMNSGPSFVIQNCKLCYLQITIVTSRNAHLYVC